MTTHTMICEDFNYVHYFETWARKIKISNVTDNNELKKSVNFF
jgi:hypothetical protein